MALNDSQLAILKTELDTDPNSLGYAAANNSECAALLNAVDAANPIDVSVVDGQELSKAVVISEYTVLSAAERDGWTTILAAGNGQVDINDARVVAQIAAIWGAGTATRANLLALKIRDGSRAETVFGVGSSVTAQDVAEARLI